MQFRIIYENSVRILQKAHYISATTPNQLMVRETDAVYCENHTKHTNTHPNNIREFSPYLTRNTLRLRYKAQRDNAIYCENHTEHTLGNIPIKH
jgi:hypothetical protein